MRTRAELRLLRHGSRNTAGRRTANCEARDGSACRYVVPAYDSAVEQLHRAVGPRGDVGVMSDDDQRGIPLAPDPSEQFHDADRVGGIDRTRGLLLQEDMGIIVAITAGTLATVV